MEAEFSHLPVMPREVVELLLPVPAGLFVDCTVGGGGHAALLLEARSDIRLLGIDRDADAVEAARVGSHPSGRGSRWCTDDSRSSAIWSPNTARGNKSWRS